MPPGLLVPLSIVCFGAVVLGQGPIVPSVQFTTGAVEVRRWFDNGAERAEWSSDGGSTWRRLRGPDDRLHLQLATFDPLVSVPSFTGALAVPNGTRLRLVQFHSQVLGPYRDAVTAAGGEILHYLPANGLFVRCAAADVPALTALPCVRWVGDLANAFKLDAALRAFVQAGNAAAVDCNLVLATKADRLRAAGAVVQAGGLVVDLCDGSVMIRASLKPAQLLAVLATDHVIWADLAGADGADMDNARVQCGANYVESVGGYTGQGIRVEVTEAFEETHPDLLGRVLVRGGNFADLHGHCTAGIVAGAGISSPAARGVLPDGFLIEAPYSSANHYAQIQGSADPGQPWLPLLATASWGAATTTAYTAISMAMDDALFDSGLLRFNSMSNTGSQLCRPEAWAKNIVSVGGIKHLNDSFPGNDRWNQVGDSSAASIGPAADGRLKPDIAAYYDGVLTSDLTGGDGYSGNDFTTGFGGTSAATPIVAGHAGILAQMFTDGVFGNPLPLPATDQNRWANRAKMTTMKALLCNTAQQYPFAGAADDLTRTHQGWGLPDLRRAYDERESLAVFDEYDTLQLGQAREYWVFVAPGTPEFRVTMVYADPAAVPAAAITLVNDLDLRVTRVDDGAFWWGNNGLDVGTASTSGGLPNDRDTIECVYLPNPVPGLYLVRVEAASIVADGEVATPALDVDFALVMHPVQGFHNDTGVQLDLRSSGPGDLRIACSGLPAGGWTDGRTLFSFAPARGVGFGRVFGLEDDSLTGSLFGTPAAVGNPFHFVDGGAGEFPLAEFQFDPVLVLLMASFGIKLDAVVVLWNGPDVVAVSNVDRIHVQ